jgi:hypothetical protein
MSHKKSSVRPEAGVLGWKQLSADQREAATAIVDTLDGMARAPGSSRRRHDWSFLPPIDRIRRNHVFLIDGKRGSGKSTLLVTLLDAWNRRALHEEIDAEDEKLCPWSGPAVLPVGLLDLQPMDASTNLLLHLIGTLQRVVDFLETRSTPRELKPGSWELPAEISSRPAWRKFAKAAVAAGRGVQAPSRSMDLEEQVAEMEYRERERLDLTRAFVELVDTLHEDTRAWLERERGKAPEGMIFVVGIDDADMNPYKSVELLELLRTLWHPHLVYVLTGESELFLKLIDVELERSAGSAMVHLAPQILDKIIPRRQRFRLDEVPVDARPDALVGALRTLGTPHEQDSKLLGYVRASAWLLPLIPGYLRRIADLAQALAEHAGELHGEVRALLVDVIDELRDDMPGFGARCAVREEGETLVFDLGLAQTAWRFHATRSRDVALPRDRPMRHAHVRTHFVAGASVAGASVAGTEPKGVPLGERYRAASLLAWQLAHELPGEYRLQAGPAALEYEPVVTLTPRPGLQGADDEVLLPQWLFPRWVDGWQHARAYACWDRMSRQLPGDDASVVDELARCFVASVLAGAGVEVKREPAGELSWETLARQVAELAAKAGPSAGWALAEAPLLATPESGLSPDAAYQWLAALSAALDERNLNWRRLCARRRSTRLISRGSDSDEVAEQLTKVEAFLERLDSRYMAYAFRASIAKEISPHFWMALTQVPVLFAGKLVDINRARGLGKEPKQWQCLADLIELDHERLWKLAALDWRKQNQLAAEIDPTAPYQKGKAQYFVHRMWRTASEAADHEVDGLVTLEDGKLRIRATPPALTCADEALGADLADGARLHLRKVRPPVYEELAPLRSLPVYPAIDGVLRLAVDLAADEADAEWIAPDHGDGLDLGKRVALRGMAVWSPFALETRYGLLHVPVPQWPALIDWEILIRSWNDTLERIHKAQAEGFGFAPSHINGFLAWYAKQIITIELERQPLAFEDVTITAWTDDGLLDQLIGNLDHYNYIRMRHTGTAYHGRDSAHSDWLRLMPAIFAPEFGLSTEAVQWPLERYAGKTYSRQPRVSDNEIPGRLLLQQARHRLWLLSGTPEEAIEEMLGRIDADHPQHPWVAIMRSEPGHGR